MNELLRTSSDIIRWIVAVNNIIRVHQEFPGESE